jgi:hypothetical protein
MTAWMRRRLMEVETNVPTADLEADIVRRALAMRKLRRIGVLWAESGRFYVSESELDPWGTRMPVSLGQLKAMVEAAELVDARKPVASERCVSGEKYSLRA